MAEYIIEDKTPEQLVKELVGLHVSSESHIPAAISAQIQLKLIGKLCDAMDAVSANMVIQSVNLRQSVEGANSNFVAESRSFGESIGGIRSSLRKFRESNERASKTLTRAIYVLAGVALIQAVILILQLLK